MKAVLVRPKVDTADRYSKPIESLGLAYVAGALRRARWDVLMHDAMLLEWSTAETIDNLLAEDFDLLAFTVVFNYFPLEIAEIAAQVKIMRPESTVVVGGHASSFFPEKILEHYSAIDAVVIGEGEEAIQTIAEALREGHDLGGLPGVVVRDSDGKPQRSLPRRITQLSKLPRPARDLVPHLLARDGIICLSTSRGCYARCTFCSIPRFYGLNTGKRHASGAWLSRGVKDSVDEIEDLHDQFGLLELLVVDDEFFGGTSFGRERALAFADCLKARELPTKLAISCRAENVDLEVMRALSHAGVEHVFVGVESGLDHDLKLFGKRHSIEQNTAAANTIKATGLSFQAGYMIFNHRSTIQDIRENLLYLQSIGECKPWQIDSAVEPHFGTPLADLMEREGGALISDTTMQSCYPDPEVRKARELLHDLCTFFVPFQGAIQRLQSAITVEWRRKIAHRTQETQVAINEMERDIHDACTGLVTAALDLIDRKAPMKEAKAALNCLKEKLKPKLWTAVGLVAIQIEREEGVVKYYTQLDLIKDRMKRLGIRHRGLKLVC